MLYTLIAVSIYVVITLRTLVIGGIFYAYTYHFKRDVFQKIKFNPDFPNKETMLKELKLSMKAGVVFVIWDLLVIHFYLEGHTLIYTQIENSWGWLYIPLSFVLVMLLHDAYFYWTHRWMHIKSGHWIKHGTHHEFHNPTPWSAFSVSFEEGMVQMFFHFLIVFIIPLHPITIAMYIFGTFISNTIGHSGLAIGKQDSKIFSSSSNHFNHHRYGRVHFGLYFNFWDRLMGTELKS